MLLLLSLLAYDIEGIIEGKAMWSAGLIRNKFSHLLEFAVWFYFDIFITIAAAYKQLFNVETNIVVVQINRNRNSFLRDSMLVS